jgi:hypothetical protein
MIWFKIIFFSRIKSLFIMNSYFIIFQRFEFRFYFAYIIIKEENIWLNYPALHLQLAIVLG